MIELKGVCKGFVSGKEMITPVNDVNLTLEPGKVTVVVGPSGSGKSTLLSIIGLLLRPDSGEIHFDGQDVRRLKGNALARVRSRSIGFVFQDFNLLEHLTALENVRLARTLAGLPKDDALTRGLLELVGLGERMDSRAQNLSGGEKQRVAMCRALANGPKLLLADEPTGNLDSKHGQETIDLIKGLIVERQMASLIVTHDLGLAAQADAVYEMHDGTLSPSPGLGCS